MSDAKAAGDAGAKKDRLRDEIAEICLEWWRELNGLDRKTGKDIEGVQPNREALARLRRIGIDETGAEPAVDVAAAAAIGAYRQLLARLRGILAKWHTEDVRRFAASDGFPEAAAVVAATLARIRADAGTTTSTAELLGAAKGEDQKVMAEARFKRLIRTRDWPGLLDQGRRIVMLLGRDQVPVGDLAASLLLWNFGPGVIRRWSFAYYGAADAAPTSDLANGTADDATDATATAPASS